MSKEALRLVESIEKMANALEELGDSPFNRTLLVLYIQDKTKLGKTQINSVLDAVDSFVEEIKGKEEVS